MSLERELPLLISLLLVVILTAGVGFAYREVRQSAAEATVERLGRVSHQLAGLARASTTQRAELLHTIAGTGAVRRALKDPSPAAVAAATPVLARLAIPQSDTALPILLVSADGRDVVALDAAPSPVADTAAAMGTSVNDTGDQATVSVPVVPHGLALSSVTDSARYGTFYTERGGVYYWLAAPVREGGRRLGWIVQQARIATRPDAERRITGLIGSGSAVFFRNDSGGFWTTLGGVPVAGPPSATTLAAGATAPARPGSAAPTTRYDRPGVGPVISATALIAGTPWAVVLELPRSALTAGARAMLLRFATFGLLLLAAGALASWAISRRVTRPISQLTGAALRLAQGDYATRVDESGSEEVAQLATSFNRMAGEVAASHAQLARQFAEARALAAELEQARTTAVAASRAKSSFLATMSHEIRTPINAILGYTELLSLGIPGPLTPEQSDQLARVGASTQHLLALVNEVLDLARIESGTMRVECDRASVRRTVDAAVALIGPQATARRVTLRVECGCAENVDYVGDEHRVRQVLANLLSNAVKFTEPGGDIVVACGQPEPAPPALVARAGGRRYVAMRVRDTGIGIADRDIERIFEPFTQAETERGTPYTRERSGAGLGLAISRELAQLMDGDLTAASHMGEGSTFTLWLPASGDTSASTTDVA